MKGPKKLIDALTRMMDCAVCGSRRFAIIKPQSGGRFYRSRLAVPRSGLFNQESLRKALGACARN
jgi:hypothetical protein